MSGQTVAYPVRPQARSKMASMPVGVDAVFLAGETGKIVDVTFGSAEALDQASQEYHRMWDLAISLPSQAVEETIAPSAIPMTLRTRPACE